MIKDCFKSIANDWVSSLGDEIEKPYFKKLNQELNDLARNHKAFYPKPEDVFSALKATPLDQVKVVILGQDPYHGEGQAHGLSFSVRQGIAVPPSLKNIFKELQSDLGVTPPGHGCLLDWAKEGILLLNSTLTVLPGIPDSHSQLGWSEFTDAIIKILNQVNRPLVFILWGSHAQKKGEKVDKNKHLVISSPHPSPLAAYRGFFGSRPFSKTNQFLASKNIEPINWEIKS
jgi:uracil-DNA glycosylase